MGKNLYELDRHSIRLKGFDYTSAHLAYVTIATHGWLQLFGHVASQEMILNDAGKMVSQTFENIHQHFPFAETFDHVVMPNHFHGIINISSESEGSLFDIMKWFKGLTTHLYMNGVKQNGWTPFEKKLWQSRYYDRVIRNERELQNIQNYIFLNPARWKYDSDY